MTNALPPAAPMDQSPPEPPLPPAAGPARPQLRRSGTDKMLGGVCGGLAEYSGIDTVLWRIGFVALTLTTGSGIVVYPILWVLMPSAPVGPGRQPGPLDRLADRLHGALSGAGSAPPRG